MPNSAGTRKCTQGNCTGNRFNGIISIKIFPRCCFSRWGHVCEFLYGLERFSEDLDFVLVKPDVNFDWGKYIENMCEEFSGYGYTLEVENRKKSEKAVKIAFLKADSQGGILIIKDAHSNRPKLKIKLEIDTNPPAGSQYELKYLDFPLAYSIKTLNLPSLFAGKCHDLLCREYIKGRDWYDFNWYIARQTTINFDLLSHAIQQAGPWKDEKIHVISAWLLDQLEIKITAMDWKMVKQDVIRFLKPREVAMLEIWSKDFFMSRLEKLSGYLK